MKFKLTAIDHLGREHVIEAQSNCTPIADVMKLDDAARDALLEGVRLLAPNLARTTEDIVAYAKGWASADRCDQCDKPVSLAFDDMGEIAKPICEQCWKENEAENDAGRAI